MKAYYIFVHFPNNPLDHAVVVDPYHFTWLWDKDPTMDYVFWATEEQLENLMRQQAIWATELHTTITVVEI